MANKSILSILALAGDKAAATTSAAHDLHAALFHLCHAGQATPLSDTFESLANRGKSAKVRAVVSDYWQAAAAYRAQVKADGKLDRSGRFVGLQADNIPFALSDITDDLETAVAVVKKVPKDAAKPEGGKVISEAVKAEDEAAGVLAGFKLHLAIVEAENVQLQDDKVLMQERIDQLEAENAQLLKELHQATLQRAA